MKLNDNTILRIKVPAHLYESVKAQLTINEGQNFGTKDMKAVKVKDSSSSDKPKKTSAPKKANAPQKATGAIYDKETSKLGAGVSETKKTPKDGHKKMGLDELKALAEMLKSQIAEMEKQEEEKAPVEEEKIEETKELTKEWNPYDRDEPDEYDPRDYELGYAKSGGRSYSRRDYRRKMSGLYSDDEIAAAQQADAIKAGRISAPKQTPEEL